MMRNTSVLVLVWVAVWTSSAAGWALQTGSLADMARRSGMTRAAMTHYASGQRQSGFPAPVAKVSSNSPLWDWAEVAQWLCRHKRLDADSAKQAAILHAANAALTDSADFAEALARRVRREELAVA